jgi:hypothetical protein
MVRWWVVIDGGQFQGTATPRTPNGFECLAGPTVVVSEHGYATHPCWHTPPTLMSQGHFQSTATPRTHVGKPFARRSFSKSFRARLRHALMLGQTVGPNTTRKKVSEHGYATHSCWAIPTWCRTNERVSEHGYATHSCWVEQGQFGFRARLRHAPMLGLYEREQGIYTFQSTATPRTHVGAFINDKVTPAGFRARLRHAPMLGKTTKGQLVREVSEHGYATPPC